MPSSFTACSGSKGTMPIFSGGKPHSDYALNLLEQYLLGELGQTVPAK